MSGVPYSSSASLPSELTNLQTVGIGTSNPTEKLHIVNGNIKATGGSIEVGKDTNVTCHLGRGRIHSQSFGAGSAVTFSHNNTLAGDGLGLVQTEAGETWLNSDTGKTLTFRIAGLEKMRVHSDGNIGINQTSPAEALDVGGNIKASGNVIATNIKNYYQTTNSENSTVGDKSSTTQVTRWCGLLSLSQSMPRSEHQLPRACQLPRAWIELQRKCQTAAGGGGSSSCRVKPVRAGPGRAAWRRAAAAG